MIRITKNSLALTSIGLATVLISAGLASSANATNSGNGNPLSALGSADPSALTTAAAVPTNTSGSNAIDAAVEHTTITVPVDPSAGITLRAGPNLLTVGLPFADSAGDATVEAPGIVSYDNNNGSTTIPSVTQKGSLKINTVIANSSAPTRYDYLMTVPAGGRLELLPSGAIEIRDASGNAVGSVAAPWARDAHGTTVATHYEVSGNTVTQVVEHSAARSAYPVVADPDISMEWWRYVVTLTASETQTVADTLRFATDNLGDPATAAGALCDLIPFELGAKACKVGIQWKIGAWSESINQAAAENQCIQIGAPYLTGPPFWSVTKVQC